MPVKLLPSPVWDQSCAAVLLGSNPAHRGGCRRWLQPGALWSARPFPSCPETCADGMGQDWSRENLRGNYVSFFEKNEGFPGDVLISQCWESWQRLEWIG